MGLGVEGQFLDRKEEIRWPLEKNEWKMVVVLCLKGQIHTHKGRVFLCLVIFVVVKSLLVLR